MSDLIERAKEYVDELTDCECHGCLKYGAKAHLLSWQGDKIVQQSERTRIADDLEALSQKTPLDAMVTALLAYADKLRKND